MGSKDVFRKRLLDAFPRFSIEDVKKKIIEKTEQVKENVSKVKDEATERIIEGANRVKETTIKVKDTAAEKIKEGANKVKESAQKITERIKHTIIISLLDKQLNRITEKS